MARTYKRDRYGKFSATAGGRATRPDGTKGTTQVIKGPKAPIANRVAVPAGRKPATKPRKPKPAPPKFVGKLKEQNFKEVAKEGSYTYGYARADTGKLYYVGVGRTADRPFRRQHNTMVPSDRRQVVVLKSGLTLEQAAAQEKRYVARYGRLGKGTGRLHNRTAGGAGTRDLSPESRAKKSVALKAAWSNPEIRARQIAASRSRAALAKRSASYKATIAKVGPSRATKGAAELGISVDAYNAMSYMQRSRARRRKREDTPEVRINAQAKRAELYKAKNAQIGADKMAKGAAELGISVDAYTAMTRQQRSRARKKKREGPGPAKGEAVARRGAADLGISVDAYMAMSYSQRSKARRKKREASGG